MNPRDAVAKSVIAFEGGDSNHPADRGGATRYGLTFTLFCELWPGSTYAKFQALTRDDVIDLLTEHFALAPGYWRLADPSLRWAVIDFAIHSGIRTATRALQRAAGVKDDGIFGPQTEYAVNGLAPERLLKRVTGERLEHLGRLLTRDPKQSAFALGWLRRVATVLTEAA